MEHGDKKECVAECVESRLAQKLCPQVIPYSIFLSIFCVIICTTKNRQDYSYKVKSRLLEESSEEAVLDAISNGSSAARLNLSGKRNCLLLNA